jgi:beta-phosphoglucomutase-like phosphatase (HAD superfamily)
MAEAVIFDIDGTLVDSVDLQASAWVDAFRHFGHQVLFEEARRQIGKGGDQFASCILVETGDQQYRR